MIGETIILKAHRSHPDREPLPLPPPPVGPIRLQLKYHSPVGRGRDIFIAYLISASGMFYLHLTA